MQNAAPSLSAQNPPEQELALQSRSDVSVRALPSTFAPILGTVSPTTRVIATGRSQDNAWIRVRFGAETGWIAAQFFGDGFDPSSLLLVSNPSEPVYAPMQAFYLTSGIGRPLCNQVPDDGMLVQTPQGVASINLVINEVSVQMGSTVYFSINDRHGLDIAPVKGSARISSHGRTRTIVEGGYIEVPMDDDFRASGEPSEPQSYLGDEDIEDLPYSLLEEEVEPDEGLSEEELENLENLEPLLEFVNVEEADDLFNYAEETENPDLVEYLLEEGYTDFGNDLETYIQEDLGYDLGIYETYTGESTDNQASEDSSIPTDIPDDSDTGDTSGGNTSGGDTGDSDGSGGGDDGSGNSGDDSSGGE